MYEKKKVAFTNKKVFGNRFKNNISLCFCKVTKMMFQEKINVNGTINIEMTNDLLLEELWSYIYYLYFYNKGSIDLFKSMMDKKTRKATAIKFYETVIAYTDIRNSETSTKPAKPFDNTILIEFINKVLAEYKDDLINPVFDYLFKIMQREVNLTGITVRTGDKGNVSVMTKPDNVKNSNIKITLKPV